MADRLTELTLLKRHHFKLICESYLREDSSEIVMCTGGSSFVLLFWKVNYISFILNPYIIQQTRIAITVDFLSVGGDGEVLISEDRGWEESFVPVVWRPIFCQR